MRWVEMCRRAVVEHLRGVNRVISETPTWHIVRVMEQYLNSSTFSLKERRRVRNMIDNGPKLLDYEGKPFAPTYHGTTISSFRLKQLRHEGWALYIPVMIEFALENKRQTFNDLIPKLDTFMSSTGHPEMSGRLDSPKSKGVVTAALILGGVTYKSVRKLDGQVSRVFTPAPGTEMLELQDRIDLAMKRCKELGIDEQDAHTVPETLKDLI